MAVVVNVFSSNQAVNKLCGQDRGQDRRRSSRNIELLRRGFHVLIVRFDRNIIHNRRQKRLVGCNVIKSESKTITSSLLYFIAKACISLLTSLTACTKIQTLTQTQKCNYPCFYDLSTQSTHPLNVLKVTLSISLILITFSCSFLCASWSIPCHRLWTIYCVIQPVFCRLNTENACSSWFSAARCSGCTCTCSVYV